jgi:tetratricopeptide (TPR) repeat protein
MKATPERLARLFADYLQDQTAAQALGLGFPEPADEVVPHEAVPAQPVDPQLAWAEALAVLTHLAPSGTPRPTVPPDWPNLVMSQEPAVAVPFCLGNFPQMVRHLQPLLAGRDWKTLRRMPVRPLTLPALSEWAVAQDHAPQNLLAVAALRLAGHFDQAQQLLDRMNLPAAWQALQANEAAALTWQRGDAEEAARTWQEQEPSVPVLFNRGLAALFLGQPAAARQSLTEAVESLPETGSWHHLGRLYLTLAH